jgi:hypothetical protein
LAIFSPGSDDKNFIVEGGVIDPNSLSDNFQSHLRTPWFQVEKQTHAVGQRAYFANQYARKAQETGDPNDRLRLGGIAWRPIDANPPTPTPTPVRTPNFPIDRTPPAGV